MPPSSATRTTTDHGLGPAARGLAAAERARVWLVTGAPGRGAAFGLDFLAAVRRGLRARRR
jgi:hypothetical protein